MLAFEGVQDTSACWSICLEISRDSKAPFTLWSQGDPVTVPGWLLVLWRQGLTPRMCGAGMVVFWP